MRPCWVDALVLEASDSAPGVHKRLTTAVTNRMLSAGKNRRTTVVQLMIGRYSVPYEPMLKLHGHFFLAVIAELYGGDLPTP